MKFKDDADKWLKYIGTIYSEYKGKWYKMAHDAHFLPDDGLLDDTIIKCYEAIARNGIRDNSPQGMRNYLFRAFKTNLNITDSYYRRKDDNAETPELSTEDEGEKTKRQLLSDYSVIRIMEQVEENFDNLTFHCFRLKHLTPMTYKKLKELTGVEDCRKRVTMANKWVKENITKQQLLNEFEQRTS